MSDSFTPNADELLENNRRHAERFDAAGLRVEPSRRLAVVACMDSRMDTFEILGLRHGEAHIIRNAGGVITDDVIRSLCLSQRFLGTREVILVHHTDCGLQRVGEDEFKESLERELGVRPGWLLESFSDPHADVAQSMRRLEMNPFILHRDHIRGFVYDVETGVLHEVTPSDSR
ncbi:MAG: carbonic anhydrase [Ilumatobacteraceae bacterium]|nr:carbonic anhydrase [Ilumatobacteraceae bacterium]